MSDFDEIIGEFLVECFEGLDQLDGELVALEADPDDLDTLSSIFRTIHSMKGASGFLEFSRLEKLAHAGENLLDAMRSSKLSMDEDIASVLLDLNDNLRSILRVIEATGNDAAATDPAYDQLVVRLTDLIQDSPSGDAQSAADVSPAKAALEQADEAEPEAESIEELSAEAIAAVIDTTPEEPVAQTVAPKLKGKPTPGGAGTPASAGGSAAESSIRVRVDHLDALMNLAGELVLARNQIIQHASLDGDPAVATSAQRLNHITTELQERVMKIRMQPIGLLWSKLPRIVRDLSSQLRKEVSLDLVGAETELDKTLLEAIKDPLTHLVRNALDHGIEEPDEREGLGKPREAVLRLSSYHESGQVMIVIEDDGRGIDVERIKAKAVEKGVISANAAQALDPRAALELLFAPGFSTAEQVTNVSGRGVGMDVVRRNLERVGGTVSIETELGQGTRVLVRIPLTLAIIPALTIYGAGERYAIPQANLVELVRVEAGRDERIEWLQGKPVFRLRGRLLSLLDLNEQLGIERSEESDGRSIVVVQASGQTFGLLVDEILETEEIVVKPLGRHVSALQVYAGTTILGDGRVALILDIAGLAAAARLKPIEESSRREGRSAADADIGSTDDNVVVFDVGGERRMAVALRDVARLEEIQPERIETVGRQLVMQYRGAILPLLDMDAIFAPASARPIDRTKPIKAIVQQTELGAFGIVVNHVVDIVQIDPGSPRQPAAESGVAEILIVDGQVTELLDVAAVATRSMLEGASLGNPDEDANHSIHGGDLEADRQVCTFRVGGALFGIDVLEVQEVLRPQQKTPIPLAEEDIKGLINLRGETVVLLDLHQQLGAGYDALEADPSSLMNVVLRMKDGVVAILVDEIGEVLELSDDSFEPCPVSIDDATRHIAHGVYKIDGELLLLLDVRVITGEGSTELDKTTSAPEELVTASSRN